MNKPAKMTPMLEQYFELKRQAPDAILLFRLGDFYEMFFEDAELAAPVLDLVLTSRGKGGDWEAPMCGVPYHAADQYIAKLIRRGFRVAICDQVEDPSQAKGIVRREIVRVVTPGTAVDGTIVDRENRYLLSVAYDDDCVGGAWLDVSTGDFFVTAYQPGDQGAIRDDISRFAPKEAVLCRETNPDLGRFLEESGITVTPADDSYFDPRSAAEYLERHFGTSTLKGFGLEQNDARSTAAGAALRYAVTRHKRDLAHVTTLRLEQDRAYLMLDSATLRNLEIFEARDDGRSAATLWSVVNRTKTAMGSRLLRQWISRPLCQKEAIFDRHDAVDELVQDNTRLEALGRELSSIADIERLTARVTLGSATPRECVTLAESLRSVGRVRDLSAAFAGSRLGVIRQSLDPLSAVSARVDAMIADDPPASTRDGGVIREGVHEELDELRAIARDSKSVLMKIESTERERTTISSLKVRYNSVFGYYIEVSKANLNKVPEDYIRKQTLVNAERFITPELKQIEEKILGAEDRSRAIEQELYASLLAELSGSAGDLRVTAGSVAEIDVLVTFARIAIRNRYTRPTLSDEPEILISEGRHPVIEAIATERFIPNDTSIHRDTNGIQIITGPNMGGKSTYLRQVALIVLLSQAGSFVPAESARLGVFDRVFTRVGASDNLARGESTFMVEMLETANILNNATKDSLIILDEVGRGTATFDGLSLAWAIIEYLHDHRGAITLFATHYHEVTDLTETRERVSNFNLAVKEWKDQIIFLRKVVPGAADKSYGIQVAKLAGIPATVTERARQILLALERKEHDVVDATRQPRAGSATAAQLSLFSTREEDVLREILRLDPDQVTPMDALVILSELRKKLTESR